MALQGYSRQGGSGEDWHIDLAHMPINKGLEYLLVWVDTFTRRVEAFPHRTEQAREAIKAWVQEIPHFNTPRGIQSDSGPAFSGAVTQGVSRPLGIDILYTVLGGLNPQRK